MRRSKRRKIAAEVSAAYRSRSLGFLHRSFETVPKKDLEGVYRDIVSRVSVHDPDFIRDPQGTLYGAAIQAVAAFHVRRSGSGHLFEMHRAWVTEVVTNDPHSMARAHRITAVLRDMPLASRRAVICCAAEGMNCADAAATIGVSKPNLKEYFVRAMATLDAARRDAGAASKKHGHAAEWLLDVMSAGSKRRYQFAHWLEAEGRIRCFLEMSVTAAELQGLYRQRALDLEAILHKDERIVVPIQKPGGADSVASVPANTAHAARRRRILHWVQGCVSVVVASCAIGFGTLWWHKEQGVEYRTGVGEQRSIDLDDGSGMRMNVMSKVSVRFSGQARDVSLDDGEVTLKVAHVSGRPFTVHLGAGVTAQAVGTVFNVYRRGARTRISVLDGRLELRVRGGQRFVNRGRVADFGSDGLVRVREARTDDAVVWHKRRLLFEDAGLREIAEEYNRYNSAVQIEIAPGVGDTIHLNAAFDADRPEEFAAAAAGLAGLKVTSVQNRIVVRPL